MEIGGAVGQTPERIAESGGRFARLGTAQLDLPVVNTGVLPFVTGRRTHVDRARNAPKIPPSNGPG